jgi:uncharacterized protein
MAAKAVRDIYEGRSFFAPQFELVLGGRKAQTQIIHDVIDLSFQDDIDQLGSCDLTLNAWDDDKQRYKYIDDGIFDPGTDLELKMGYRDGQGLVTMLRGSITSVSVDFPSSGGPTLRVRALSELQRLYLEQKTEVFEGTTDIEVAEQLLADIEHDNARRASEAGVKPVEFRLVTEEGMTGRARPRSQVFLENEYPIVFLKSLARRNGCDLYLEDQESDGGVRTVLLHFRPPSSGQAVSFRLRRGESLVDFSIDLQTSNQLERVEVRGWDPLTKEPVVGEATWQDLSMRPFEEAEDVALVERAVEGAREVVSEEPVSSEEEAKTMALGKLEERVKQMVTASGSTVGVPELRAGRPIFIDGIGRRFSGRWFVTSTNHSFGSGGYQTTFEARKEEKV